MKFLEDSSSKNEFVGSLEEYFDESELIDEAIYSTLRRYYTAGCLVSMSALFTIVYYSYTYNLTPLSCLAVPVGAFSIFSLLKTHDYSPSKKMEAIYKSKHRRSLKSLVRAWKSKTPSLPRLLIDEVREWWELQILNDQVPFIGSRERRRVNNELKMRQKREIEEYRDGVMSDLSHIPDEKSSRSLEEGP